MNDRWDCYEGQDSTDSAACFFRLPPMAEPVGGMAGFEGSASLISVEGASWRA